MKKLLFSFLLVFSLSVSAQTTCDTLSNILSNTTGLGTTNFNPATFLDSLNADFGQSNTLAYYFPLLQACGDSCGQILPCSSLDSALYMLSAYGGNGPPYDLLFVEAYLGIVYPNYDALDTASWSQILSCCYSPLINYGSGDTLSHCDQVEYLAILMQNVLPGRHCYPSWLYTNLLQSFLPQLPGLASDSTLSLLCTDLETCKANCLPVCDNEILSGCDSVLSVAYTYEHILANEGLSSDTSLLETLYGIMFGYAPVYNTILSQINNCSISPNMITEISYSAQNVSYSDSAGQYFVDMDVFVRDSPAGLLYSQSVIYIQYDSAFGSNVVSNNLITASKGNVIDSPYYTMALSDSTPQLMKIQISHSDSVTSLPVIPTDQQLCHLRVSLSGINLTNVAAAWDTVQMANQSEYKQTPDGLEYPYDIIRVSGLVGAPRSSDSSITFSIQNVILSPPGGNPTQITFDIDAITTQPNNLLIDAIVTISGNYNAFNFPVVYWQTLTCADSIYGIDAYGGDIYAPGSISDLGTNEFQYSLLPSSTYNIDSNQYTPSISSTTYTTIATCTLLIGDCDYSPNLAVDTTASEGDYYSDNNGAYYYCTFNPEIAGSGYNNNGLPLCVTTPQVDSLSSDCIGAGVFDTLTINGSGFSYVQGSVFFTDASAVGGFFQCVGADILLWTPTQIQMYIPSYPNTAASGNFYIQNAVGTDNSADSNKINIGYAVSNYRNPYDSTAQVMFRQDTPFVFQLDATLWNTPGVIATVQHVMADMNCQMGANFSLDTSGPSAINSVYQSFINLISIQPSTYYPFQSDSGALAYTDRLENIVTCVTNLPQYNNIARQVHQVNISFRAAPNAPGYTWNWSDADTPTNHQFDFATTLAHELGHAAMLEHNRPQSSGDVMYASISNGEVLRVYDNDPNDIGGVYRALSIGAVQGAAGGCGYSAQTFSGTCTRTGYACTAYYPQLGISDIAISPSFSVWLYPNPYQDNTVVHIDVSTYSNFTISVYDVIGHLISEQHISSGTSFDVPLSDFHESAGIYLVQVSDASSRLVFKMVKL